MPPSRATLKQVAARAGVSQTTASFVLNGRDQEMRIAENTRHRVLRAARELNYYPNLMARGLRTKLTRTLALISDTIATEQYAGRLVQGTLMAAVEHGHLLFVGETEGDPALESELIADLLARHVDGIIYAAMFTHEVEVPLQLDGQRFVLLNCMTADPAVSAVLPDERSAGQTAARVLLEADHRDQIFVIGERAPDTFAGRERLAGVEEVLASAGVTLSGVVDCRWWPESAYEAVRDLLAAGTHPRALICLNDRIALGTYQALHDGGQTIPADVSVVSFDDSDLASWLRPQLTSIELPHFDMGRRAVELLLGADASNGTTLVPMPVRARASVAPP